MEEAWMICEIAWAIDLTRQMTYIDGVYALGMLKSREEVEALFDAIITSRFDLELKIRESENRISLVDRGLEKYCAVKVGPSSATVPIIENREVGDESLGSL